VHAFTPTDASVALLNGPGGGAPALEWQVRGGLPNFSAQAARGGDVRVAYLGGSITAADGWRVLTTAFLRETLSSGSVIEIFAAVPGTGSDLGACRLDRDVLRHEPDLIFVEFAVNDTFASERIGQTIEGIVRQTWRARPATDICFIYTLSAAGLPDLRAGRFPASVQAMECVAEAYGIPSIHLGVDVVRRLSAGTLVFQAPADATDLEGNDSSGRLVFTPDDVHPTPAGHRIYFATIARAWPQLMAVSSPLRHALGAPLSSDHWESAQFVPLTGMDRSGSWKLLAATDPRAGYPGRLIPPTWLASAPGAAVEFRFAGKAFGLLGLSGPDSGEFRVTVDDQPPARVTFFDHYSSANFTRLKPWFCPLPLEDREHTVRVELLGTSIDKAGIKKTGGQSLEDPAAYRAHRLHLCGVLVVGKLTAPPVPRCR